MQTLQQRIQQFNSLPTICHWLQFQSANVWERIRFSRLMGLDIFETTLTQNILFDFWRFSHDPGLGFNLLEATNEQTNGNDLEIFLETPRGYLLLPTQAKLLYPTNVYQQIAHGRPSRFQLNLLIDYARRRGRIPFYLLYNFCPDPTLVTALQTYLSEPVELLGCSMAPAQFIADHYFLNFPRPRFHAIPTFADLHPSVAFGWHRLLCPSPVCAIISQLSLFTDLRWYTYTEIVEDPEWKSTVAGARIGLITPDRFDLSSEKQDTQDFRPQFRLLLSQRGVERVNRRIQ